MTAVAQPQARAAALDRIKRIVGERGWIADTAAMAPYLAETRGLFRGETDLVVRPASTEEAAQVVRACVEAEIAMVPQQYRLVRWRRSACRQRRHQPGAHEQDPAMSTR